MGIRKPRNSIQHVWIAKVSLCYSFLSIHIIWEPTRYGLEEKTELLILSLYFMSNWNGKVLRFYSDTRASLPLLASALNSHFKVFLRSGRRKTGDCSFTAAPIGGKLDFPVFLRSKGRKSGNCSFTASFIGGKLDFPVFLRSERRKTGNCRHATGTFWLKSFDPISYPFFPSFACWWVMGRDLVPQNEGCACVNNSWVK